MVYGRRKFKRRSFRRGRRYTAKRRYSRAFSRYRRRGKGLTIFPFKGKTVKITYVDYINLTPAVHGAFTPHVWRANSIFDPDFTGGGHQPMYHDKLAAEYWHYNVLYAKATFRFTSFNSTGTNYPLHVGAFVVNDTSPLAGVDAAELIEQRRCKWKIIHSTPLGTPSTWQCTVKYKPRVAYGCKDPMDLQDKIGAQFGANPDDQTYFVVFCQQATGLPITALPVTVKIDYYVKCSERRLQEVKD